MICTECSRDLERNTRTLRKIVSVSMAICILAIHVDTASPKDAVYTLTRQQMNMVTIWLSSQVSYRLASDSDCKCSDEIAEVRTGYNGTVTAVPDYHPYQAVGDFNGDGSVDVAIAVVDTSKERKEFALVVFNGPVHADSRPPSFLRSGLNLEGTGLFVNTLAGRPKRHSILVVGAFASEGVPLIPHGTTYTFDWVR